MVVLTLVSQEGPEGHLLLFFLLGRYTDHGQYNFLAIWATPMLFPSSNRGLNGLAGLHTHDCGVFRDAAQASWSCAWSLGVG